LEKKGRIRSDMKKKRRMKTQGNRATARVVVPVLQKSGGTPKNPERDALKKQGAKKPLRQIPKEKRRSLVKLTEKMKE